MVCNHCNHHNSDQALFCANCGNKLEASPNQIVDSNSEVAAAKEIEVAPSSRKGSSLKFGIPLAIALAAIVAIILVNPFGKSDSSIVTYIKDNELLSRDLNEEEAYALTASFFEDDELKSELHYLGENNLVFFSENGKYIYYFDDIDEDLMGNLYRKEVSQIKDNNVEPVKISSNVNVTPGPVLGSQGEIIYMKEFFYGEGGRLYVSNEKAELKIDDEVFEYQLAPDGKSIYYIKISNDGDRNLYYKTLGTDSEKVKIDSEIQSMMKIASDGSKIYFSKLDDEDAFTTEVYVYDTKKADKKKLVKDVAEVKKITDQALIYLKAKKVSYDFDDLINDDLAQQDMELVEPVYPDYDDFTIVKTEDYYGSTYSYEDIDYDAYYQARDKYYELVDQYNLKQRRDEIRAYYTNNPIETLQYDLYQYADDKEQLVSENVTPYETYFFSGKNGAMLYCKVDERTVNKVKMSEIDLFDGIYSLYDRFDSQPATHVVLRTSSGKEVEIESIENVTELCVNEDFSKLYFLDDYDIDNSEGTLMEYTLNAEGIAEKKTIDKEVATLGSYLNQWSTIIYFKDLKYGLGELYIKNGDTNVKVADDVDVYSLKSLDGGETIYCLSDVSTKDYTGDLSVISNFAKRDISDDVDLFYLRSASEVIYFKDYNYEKQRGELWFHNGGEKSIKIDDDVTKIMTL